ncbi:MAG: hypothetical protein AMK72_14050 [Planctomycetes bacterium SM23_25]|nr:MAG: hypothetical protein AMK72_14050 [Planctomycetes bacterium SM23_25]
MIKAIADRIANWRRRHRNTANFYLHMLGIPACFLAAPLMLIFQQWLLAVVLFVGGYALQFIGHLVEGSRSGEEMFVRRLLGGGRRRRSSGPRK